MLTGLIYRIPELQNTFSVGNLFVRAAENGVPCYKFRKGSLRCCVLRRNDRFMNRPSCLVDHNLLPASCDAFSNRVMDNRIALNRRPDRRSSLSACLGRRLGAAFRVSPNTTSCAHYCHQLFVASGAFYTLLASELTNRQYIKRILACKMKSNDHDITQEICCFSIPTRPLRCEVGRLIDN